MLFVFVIKVQKTDAKDQTCQSRRILFHVATTSVFPRVTPPCSRRARAMFIPLRILLLHLALILGWFVSDAFAARRLFALPQRFRSVAAVIEPAQSHIASSTRETSYALVQCSLPIAEPPHDGHQTRFVPSPRSLINPPSVDPSLLEALSSTSQFAFVPRPVIAPQQVRQTPTSTLALFLPQIPRARDALPSAAAHPRIAPSSYPRPPPQVLCAASAPQIACARILTQETKNTPQASARGVLGLLCD
jgi:hypothetical protein